MTTTSSTVHRRFPLSGAVSLDAKVGVGSVTVHARDELTEAAVTVTPRDAGSDVAERTRIDLVGSTLTVHVPKLGGVLDLFGGRMSRAALDIEVIVPSGTPLKINSYGADVTVTGRCGSTDIGAGSSRTELEYVDGDLRLRYGSGPARVGRVTGPATIKSGSGDVHIEEGAQRVVMACGSGTLEIGVAHGPVWMRAGSGQASIGVAEADVDLATGSGGLEVGLRPGQTARLDVTTGSGQLRSDLPLKDARPATGSVITIRARTGNGDVRVGRSAS